MLKFFTNGTWRPRIATIVEAPTPVGERCLACGEAIRADDCGISMLHMDAIVTTTPTTLAALSDQLHAFDAYRPWHLACFQDSLGIIERIEA